VIIKVAGFQAESIVDGPGIRFTVFLQGCSHRCQGCHNPETHDPAGGSEFSVSEILTRLNYATDIDGVTLSGGEPFEQVTPAAFLAKKISELGYNLVIYSGYTFEELSRKANHDQDVRSLLQAGNILVDGPFMLAEKDLTLAYRGSKNQRLIDLPQALREGKPVSWNSFLSEKGSAALVR